MENHEIGWEEYLVEDAAGSRLDVFISSVADITRSQAQRLIELHRVSVDGEEKKANYRLRSQQRVNVAVLPPQDWNADPEDIPINIVYQDADICVVDKPQGMVVHPAPGHPNGTLVNALLYHIQDLSGIGGVLRPGIVHRIDRMTSGLIVIAKNDAAHGNLAEQFKEHTARRNYLALVHGGLREDYGTVHLPIGRDVRDRKRMAVVSSGRDAITHWRVVERFEKYVLLSLELETGRTHQIRVHMAHMGHPIAGDEVYGPVKQVLGLKGQALHAFRLRLTHPRTGEEMVFVSELPEYFLLALKKISWSGNMDAIYK